ncbi:MAG: Fur family ferric uptake transcriptional regulator [Saprospiraceae bacterium]|jgi:Fur family ferric uptake transcriptional regulator
MKNAELILEEKLIRITPIRQLLLEYFLEENKTVGLVDLEKAFPRADRITLYRSLKTFVKKGILHSVSGTAAEVKYALCSDCTESQH